jgi:hypothetical protein
MNGFDANGNNMAMAGSFKADGAGHITAGAVDVNDNLVASTSSSLIGTYSFESSGQGITGTITLTNTVGSITHPLAFAFALNAAGTFGTIMENSSNNFIVAGSMQQQSSASFTLAGLAGNYIITVNGKNNSAPTSALGSFTLGSAGTSTNLSFDRSIAGIGTAGPTTTSVVTLSSAPDANGRGTMVLGFNDTFSVATQTFAYYAISVGTATVPGRFIAVETDNIGTMIADASRQLNTPFSASTVITTGSVFGMAGIDAVNSGEIAAIGQLQITGAGATTGTLGWDSNDNGAIVTIPTAPGLAVTFNAATGRGTIADATGVANGLANSLVFYLTSPGTGFIMDNTTGTTNHAMAGTLTAQTGTSFSSATDFPGLSIVRARGNASTDAQTFIGAFGSTSTSAFAFLADQRYPSGTSILTGLDQNIGPITVGTITGIGRGTLLNGTETLAFYIIGPNQFIFMDEVANSPTPVFFATPD